MTLLRSSRRRPVLAGLRRLARLHGVQTAYYDMHRRRRTASVSSLQGALAALGVAAHSETQIRDAAETARHACRTSKLGPVQVAWDGRLEPLVFRWSASAGQRVGCTLECEDGTTSTWTAALGEPVSATTGDANPRLAITRQLPHGYHRLRVEAGGETAETLIIAAPRRAYSPPDRQWGVFVPLHALRSAESWGIGDLTDALTMQRWLTDLGNGVLSTLPFSAAFLGDEPFQPSPYEPASRLFWNEIYVDPRQSDEFRRSPRVQQLVQSPEIERKIRTLQTSSLVDYHGVYQIKQRVFDELAVELRQASDTERRPFERWLEDHPDVQTYAAFRATGDRERGPWFEWAQPTERQLDLALDETDERRARGYQYAQWLAERQITQLKTAARGLYLDLPVGVHAASYDVWRYPTLFAREASVGAPPDPVFTSGQNWGFPPLHPEALRRDEYRYFIAAVRHQLREASWLRIDHVMGLHRLFWIPNGLEGDAGVYVRYPAEELYAIVCLESHRAHASIIGENLGIVPAYVNTMMRRHGIRQMYVMEYEATAEATRPVRDVPRGAMAGLNTHDMPTFAAFLEGRDLDDATPHPETGISTHAALEGRTRAIEVLREFVATELGTAPAATGTALLRHCLEWLASSPAGLVLITLEDLWAELEPQNVPGTTERPNWRRKTRYPFEEFSTLPDVIETLRAVAMRRRDGV